ncbi:phosphotransferase family protein [Pseudovirgaria hyperparasitica]|uniref:Phosphotransferase family protein n=1 Tax=Pseudovirgaria hyperparasitica TaxID=470096 RepID=A0A6A6WG83_9PEZI|nr:phosphotransferase family protein [Pseudovirgaria hyperparasitica]KAF2761050.1 phosphotransferase family protein [Pseudovirgaria hyperparasitica]
MANRVPSLIAPHRCSYNERLRLLERRRYFNIHELCQVVARSVGHSSDEITSFTKVAEGGSYRVFEATFQDGLKVMVRLPYPSTLPHKYGIASEVATMEFLRLHGVPIPRVFSWDSSTSNQVGSEYIIMEKVPGVELEDTWYSMTLRERMDVVEKIVDIEKILFAIRFPASGSLYYKDSLDSNITTANMSPDISQKGTDKFCIGPSSELLWWYQMRDELDINRGPWKHSEDLLKAVGQRELTWLRKFGERRFPREPLYREFYDRQKVDPQVQIGSLLDYLKVAPHIVPDREELNQPTIRHPDLSPSNIFVNRSGEITGVIDWQRSAILPIFLQAKIPKHFQNYGDDDSENFRPPTLPDNFDSLTENEKEMEAELYRRRQLHYFYLGFTNRNNKPHFHAMGTYDLIVRNRLYDTASRPWEGDNTSLKAELVHASAYWSDIANSATKGAGFPAKYSEAEATDCLDIDTKQKNADAQMQKLRDFIGVNIDGWVPNESYNEAKEKEQYIKHEMLDAAETDDERRELDEHWPFQDHEELD